MNQGKIRTHLYLIFILHQVYCAYKLLIKCTEYLIQPRSAVRGQRTCAVTAFRLQLCARQDRSHENIHFRRHKVQALQYPITPCDYPSCHGRPGRAWPVPGRRETGSSRLATGSAPSKLPHKRLAVSRNERFCRFWVKRLKCIIPASLRNSRAVAFERTWLSDFWLCALRFPADGWAHNQTWPELLDSFAASIRKIKLERFDMRQNWIYQTDSREILQANS